MLVTPRAAKRRSFNYAPPIFMENTNKIQFLPRKECLSIIHPPAGEATSFQVQTYYVGANLFGGGVKYFLHVTIEYLYLVSVWRK